MMPDPLCLTLLICDHAHEEPQTKKKYLSGVMGRLPTGGFPLQVKGLWAYVEITECPPQQEFILRMADANEERPPLFEAKFNLACQSPLHVIDFCFPMPKMVIPQAGDYRLQLLANGAPIKERRLVVYRVGSKLKPPTV